VNPPPLMVPYRDVPVVVNSFNRHSSLRRLVTWLRRSGYRDLVVVDNASSFKPLLRYLLELERTPGVRVLRLDQNHGHTALWKADVLGELGIESEYVYSDPDIVPAPSCPPDVVKVLQELLLAEPVLFKAGLGLRLDDLPRLHRHRRAVLAWETKHWLRPAAPGLFVAPIDTTFALYRPGSERGVDELAVRTGPPYVAAHESWYSTGLLLAREDRNYARLAARNGISTRSRVHLPAWLRRWERALDSIYPLVVLAEDPACRLPGYVHLETLSKKDGTLDLGDGSVDGFYAPHGTAHLHETGITMDELRRVAKADARLVLRQVSDRSAGRGAPSDPRFEEFDTWLAALARAALDAGPPSHFGPDWRLERLQLVFDPSPFGAPHRYERLTEQIVHLRALAPTPGAPGPPGTGAPAVDMTTSRLDLHAHFELLGPVGEAAGDRTPCS